MGRWFSVARLPITPGTHRLTVPIQPWAWMHVNGKQGNFSTSTREGWRDTWASPARIGMVGGGFFRSKGIEMLYGWGKIRVLTLRVKP
jgi:hypothetical protein